MQTCAYDSDKMIKEAEKELRFEFEQIEDICDYNQEKVLKAFQSNEVGMHHFSYVSGYGHDDVGREKLDSTFASVFNTESAIVRNNIVSGTHAIACAILGNLGPGDTLLSIAGKPYDTLEEVIGIRGNNRGSLISNGGIYKQIELLPNGEVDFDMIAKTVDHSISMVTIQRSRGYSFRKSIDIDTIAKIINIVKSKNEECICFVDNCYGEFVEKREPSDVNADLIAGSLIKNPGAGIVETGGYIAGKTKYVKNAAQRLTAPGIGEYGGSMLNQLRLIFQGLFIAPTVVSNALKGAVLASYLFEKIGFNSTPKFKDKRTDIIQAIKFGDKKALINFCQTIQRFSPIDSYLTPVPDDVPGYEDKLIMAAGNFIEGSTIELSADGPLRPPYIAFMQGGLTYSHVKIVLKNILNKLKEIEGINDKG